jgi:hypothetical protein
MKAHAVIAALMLSGCMYATLKPGAQAVRVTSNPEAVRGCALLGEVRGRDGWNGGMAGQGAAERNADIALRNAAHEMGGNVILLTTESVNTSGATKRGEAYRCDR